MSEINCPKCLAAYTVPESVLTAGNTKRMRCSACGFIWMPDPLSAHTTNRDMSEPQPPVAPAPTAVAAEPEMVEPAPIPELSPSDAEALARAASLLEESQTAARRPAQPRGKPKHVPRAQLTEKDTGKVPSWVFLLVGILFASMALGLLLRTPIGRSIPAMASFYESIGLPVEMPEDWFTFEGVAANRDDSTGDVIYNVTGRVMNRSAKERDLPAIRVLWSNALGTVGPYDIVTASKDKLKPNESASFSARLVGVDTRAGGTVRVVFVAPGQNFPTSAPPASSHKKKADSATDKQPAHGAEMGSATDPQPAAHHVETEKAEGEAKHESEHTPADPAAHGTGH